MRNKEKRWQVFCVCAGLVIAGACAAQTPADAQDAAVEMQPERAPEASAGNETPEEELQPANDGQDMTVETLPVPVLDDPPKDAAPTVDAGAQLDEIVVTATRRAQAIGKVPVAVSEIDGATIEAAVLRDTQSLPMAVPSLVLSVSGGEAAGSVIRIRGVGTSGGNGGFESSVGVFVDGVYLPRSALAMGDLLDIERIEVLRGPQGTLFGKNTSVGAINIHTRKPSYEPELELTASAGSFDAYLARASFSSAAFGDTTAFRLSAQYNTRDGYIENVTTGEQLNDRDRYTLRGQFLWEPTAEMSWRLIASSQRKNELCCAAPFTVNGPKAEDVEAMGGTVFDPPARYRVALDAPTSPSAIGDDSLSLHLDWRLGETTLRGLLSYQEGFANSDTVDADNTDLDIATLPFTDTQISLYTAELSLQGEAGALDWLVGAFASVEDIALSNAILLGDDAAEFSTGVPLLFDPLYPGGSGQTLNYAQQDGQSASLFTHNVITLGRGFDVTLGLRYLYEAKDGNGFSESNSPSCVFILLPPDQRPVPPLLCGADPYRARFDDRRVTGTAALGKSYGQSGYVYASYSQGFKSGGVNLNPASTADSDPNDDYVPPTTFLPETVDAYELGLRQAFFGRALSTRTTLFWMDIDDFQLNAYDGIGFTVSNAAAVRSRGVEFESTLIASGDLAFNFGVTYNDAQYTRGAQVSLDSNVDGKQLTNAPRWTGTLGARYETALPWWQTNLFANVAARYQSTVNTGVDLDPEKEQPAYTLVNARLGLRFPREFDVSLWATNLTDAFYHQIIFDAISQPGSYNGFTGVPRMFGIELHKRFGF